MRNSDNSSSRSQSFLQSIDSIEKDERELAQSLTSCFGDISGIWNEIESSPEVKNLLKELLFKGMMPRWDWEKSRETTAEYLQFHFKYALLRDEVTLASSRQIIRSHLKSKPSALVEGALNHVKAVAALVPKKP